MNKGEEFRIIYKTTDYGIFKILKENRGQMENGGVKQSKVNELQRLVDSGDYVDEVGIIRVNKEMEIIEGVNTFTMRKNNKMPILYYFVKDERFNNGIKHIEKMNNILKLNRIDTSWNKPEIFKCALGNRAQLAILIDNLVDDHDNKFTWNEVLALITHEDEYFAGKIRSVDLLTFKNPKYIDQLNSREFKADFAYFKELNEKARVSRRKGIILKTAYAVIYKCKEIMDITLFKKAILSIPDAALNSYQTYDMKSCLDLMIKHYNTKTPNKVNIQAVRTHMNAFNIKKERDHGKVIKKEKPRETVNFQGKYKTVREHAAV